MRANKFSWLLCVCAALFMSACEDVSNRFVVGNGVIYVQSDKGVRLNYSLTSTTNVSLSIYNNGNNRVKNVHNNTSKPAGSYVDCWFLKDESGRTVAPGLYYAVFSTPAFTISRTILVTTIGLDNDSFIERCAAS